MLTDLDIRGFCDVLASKEPAPGGGSASALSGALAASLGQMTVNLSVGKKAFEAKDKETKDSVIDAGRELNLLQERLLKLVCDDTEAFGAYIAAIKLPKETEQEKEARKTAIAIAEERVVEVPFATMTACSEVFPHLITVAEHGNKNCCSDVAVAAEMAYAGLQGGMYNVFVNKMDDNTRKRYKTLCGYLLAEARKMREEIINITTEDCNEPANT